METNGDISDAFDDELAQSIERGREGLWGDEAATFSETSDAAAPSNDASATTTGMAKPPRRTITPSKPSPPPRKSRADSVAVEGQRLEPLRAIGADTDSDSATLATYAAAIASATMVLTGATALHGLLDGWRVDLIIRGAIAAIVTGTMWRRLNGDRMVAIAIGTTAYTLAFATTDRLAEATCIIALFLGLAVTIIGSAVAGVQRRISR